MGPLVETRSLAIGVSVGLVSGWWLHVRFARWRRARLAVPDLDIDGAQAFEDRRTRRSHFGRRALQEAVRDHDEEDGVGTEGDSPIRW